MMPGPQAPPNSLIAAIMGRAPGGPMAGFPQPGMPGPPGMPPGMPPPPMPMAPPPPPVNPLWLQMGAQDMRSSLLANAMNLLQAYVMQSPVGQETERVAAILQELTMVLNGQHSAPSASAHGPITMPEPPPEQQEELHPADTHMPLVADFHAPTEEPMRPTP